MKLIYVAGPFRGTNNWEIEQNIRRAETLALEVWRAGYACICPHTNTRFYQGAADDKVWLEGDIEIMLRCDAVLLTPDWRRSSGARAEVDVADGQDMPVFETLDCLNEYFKLSFDQKDFFRRTLRARRDKQTNQPKET